VEGTDNINLKVTGVNLDMLIDADFKALDVIPFRSSSVKITDLSIDLTVKVNQGSDRVKWSMVDTIKISTGDVEIDMASSLLNKLVSVNRRLIDKAMNEVVNPYIGRLLTNQVDNINKMV